MSDRTLFITFMSVITFVLVTLAVVAALNPQTEDPYREDCEYLVGVKAEEHVLENTPSMCHKYLDWGKNE